MFKAIFFHFKFILFSSFILTQKTTSVSHGLSIIVLTVAVLILSETSYTSQSHNDIFYSQTMTLLLTSLSLSLSFSLNYLFFKNILLILFLDRGEGREKEKKHQCVVASPVPPTGELSHNSGMCPDWESNHSPLVHRLALNPLSHSSRGHFFNLKDPNTTT